MFSSVATDFGSWTIDFLPMIQRCAHGLKVGSFSFECIIVSANLFYKLSESPFYKKMSKFSQKVHS